MLKKAHDVWKSGAMMRARRMRYKKFTFGDQWSDKVAMPNGSTMTEREFVRRAGYNPVTSNVIRSIVKGVVGYFRTLQDERGGYASAPPGVKEIDARTFEEFLVSGCAVQRISVHADGDGHAAPVVEQISPARFFIDCAAGEPELMGVVHDMSLARLMMQFSHGDKVRAGKLRAAFSRQIRAEQGGAVSRRAFGDSDNDGLEFLKCGVPGKCRVIEVWSRECGEQLKCHDPETGRLYYADVSEERALKRQNRERRSEGRPVIAWRWELCGYWQCRFYMPDGSAIDGWTAHGHPFAFRFYPLIDGEIHSFVEDAVEQQRNINRLLTLNDRLLAVSAKGVLLFPDNQISPTMPLEIVQENWAAPDGVVLYRGMPGLSGPEQIVSNSAKFGVDHLLDGQMKMLQEVSGVSGAMRGQDPASGTTATLYASQQRGAAVALNDLVRTFEAFLDGRDKNLMSICRQVGNK